MRKLTTTVRSTMLGSKHIVITIISIISINHHVTCHGCTRRQNRWQRCSPPARFPRTIIRRHPPPAATTSNKRPPPTRSSGSRPCMRPPRIRCVPLRFKAGATAQPQMQRHIVHPVTVVTRLARPSSTPADASKQVTRHTSHVTRHTSHVTHHTSHVTRHMSHVE